MNQERYWRNLIADEIKAEHDKVKKYYQKKGMNAGGMTQEEHTRLNIFLLCESITRTMKNSQDAPRLDTPEIVKEEPVKVEQPVKVEAIVEEKVDEVEGQMTLEDITIKDTVPVVPDNLPDTPTDPVQNLVINTPYQNEFGEIL